MTGEMVPWLILFLVGVIVGLVLLIAVVLLPRLVQTTTMTTRFRCPWTHRNVVVQFLGDAQRRPVGVISCTAFADPHVVTCEKHCLHEAVTDPRSEARNHTEVAAT